MTIKRVAVENGQIVIHLANNEQMGSILEPQGLTDNLNIYDLFADNSKIPEAVVKTRPTIEEYVAAIADSKLHSLMNANNTFFTDDGLPISLKDVVSALLLKSNVASASTAVVSAKDVKFKSTATQTKASTEYAESLLKSLVVIPRNGIESHKIRDVKFYSGAKPDLDLTKGIKEPVSEEPKELKEIDVDKATPVAEIKPAKQTDVKQEPRVELFGSAEEIVLKRKEK